MKVFLRQAQTITKPSGAVTTYAIGQNSDGEFYDVPEELADEWVKAGFADYSAKDNVVVDEKPKPEPAPVHRSGRMRPVKTADNEKES